MSRDDAGRETFSELCIALIDDGFHFLYPEVSRTSSSGWNAYIFDHHDTGGRTKLANGCGETMEEACDECVSNYHERIRISERKDELMKVPEVKEALELFNVKL